MNAGARMSNRMRTSGGRVASNSPPRLWVDRHLGLIALGLVAFVVAATVLSVNVWPATAAAGTVPYTDAQAIGYLNLYDKAGKAIKSGNVHDKPFVWTAVSSLKATAPYDGTGRKATLLAFQPRQGATPAEWSGDQLTGSIAYSDPAHPSVQATADDFSLQDFIDGFPPRWDGMLQVRMYLSAPGQKAQSTGYASTDIKVSGQTWTIVGGGPGAGPGGANIGSAALAAGSAAASASAGATASTAASASGSVSDTTGTGASDSAPSTTDLPRLRTPGYLFIAAAVVVAVVFVGVLLRRRRQFLSEGE
jgi:hypothetical protein